MQEGSLRENKISLLDCTLREAPIKDLCMGADYIRNFIKRLEDSQVNIIECGFLKDTGAREDNTIFSHPGDIEPLLINKKPTVQYVALVDYGRYNLNNLSPCSGRSVDGIRICFKKHEREVVFDYAEEIMKRGYKVYIQNVDTLGYSASELKETIQRVNKLQPEGYSIVDTFGAMYEDDLRRVYEIVNGELDSGIKLGFHAHNNLMLAVANTQSFISLAAETRALIVDGSILGCGRGAGNANTELLAEFINRKKEGTYDLEALLDIIDILMPKLNESCHWGYCPSYFLAGRCDAHVFNVDYLLKKHNIKLKQLKRIIEKLNEEQRKKYDYALLEKLCEKSLV